MDIETFTFKPEGKEEFAKGKLIKNVHIFKSGIYRGKEWTKEQVNKMIGNFKKLKETAGFDPPVRIGHRSKDSGENAKNVIGYIENMKADENGNAYADMDITDERGYKKIKDGTLRKRSAELGPYETNDGKVHDGSLWGVGFVDIPQVERLAEVNIYSKTLQEDKMDKPEKKKEKIDEKSEDTKDDSKDDSKDNSTDKGGEDEKLSKDKSKEDMKDSGDKKQSDKLDKHTELIQLDKNEYENLIQMRKEFQTMQESEKIAMVENFAKDAKIPADLLDKEKEFVLSLSDNQYGIYKELKEKQPAMVELNKKFGKQASEELADENTEKKKSEEKAKQIFEAYEKANSEDED